MNELKTKFIWLFAGIFIASVVYLVNSLVINKPAESVDVPKAVEIAEKPTKKTKANEVEPDEESKEIGAKSTKTRPINIKFEDKRITIYEIKSHKPEINWIMFKKLRYRQKSLSRKFDKLFETMLTMYSSSSQSYMDSFLRKNCRRYLFAVDASTFKTIADLESKRNANYKEFAKWITGRLMEINNRRLVNVYLEMLLSNEGTARSAAYSYFTKNIFHEYSEEIILRIVDQNPRPEEWFKSYSSYNILSIFTYYSNEKNLPMILKAYELTYNKWKENKTNSYYSVKEDNVKSFNRLLEGVTGHYIKYINLDVLTPAYWLKLYVTNPEIFTCLKRNVKCEIEGPEPTGKNH